MSVALFNGGHRTKIQRNKTPTSNGELHAFHRLRWRYGRQESDFRLLLLQLRRLILLLLRVNFFRRLAIGRG